MRWVPAVCLWLAVVVVAPPHPGGTPPWTIIVTRRFPPTTTATSGYRVYFVGLCSDTEPSVSFQRSWIKVVFLTSQKLGLRENVDARVNPNFAMAPASTIGQAHGRHGACMSRDGAAINYLHVQSNGGVEMSRTWSD